MRAAHHDDADTMVRPRERTVRRAVAGRRSALRAYADTFRRVRADELRLAGVRLTVARLLLFLGREVLGPRSRTRLLRLAGLDIGPRTAVLGSVRINAHGTPGNLHVGDRCTVNDGVFFDTAGPVHVGDDVGIGHDVLLMTSSHRIGPSERRHGSLTVAPVRVESGAWLCSRSVIQPGVTVGAGAVVLVGSVVTESVPPDTMVGGVPAQVIRRL